MCAHQKRRENKFEQHQWQAIKTVKMIIRQKIKWTKATYEGNIKSAIIMKQDDQIIKEIKNTLFNCQQH